jgi:hypothetical protein
MARASYDEILTGFSQCKISFIVKEVSKKNSQDELNGVSSIWAVEPVWLSDREIVEDKTNNINSHRCD